MKRPVGLILSAVVLSLSALFLLLIAAIMAITGVFAGHQPTFQPEPHLLVYLMLTIGFFYAALAVWAILTVIGILRLRPWARYSILIIGGGFFVLGLFGAFGSILSRTMVPTLAAQNPAADPRIMFAVFLFMAIFELLVSAIGLWWLIYFTLRPVRVLFSNPDTLLQSTVTTGRFSRTPTAIKIIGGLLLFSSVCCLFCIFLPFPAFILGFILPLKATRILYLVFAVVAALAGYGLLRLQESARLLTIGFLIFGCCNLALAALPWYRARLNLYTTELTAQITSHLPTVPGQPQFDWTDSGAFYLICLIWGVVVYGVIFWFLHRHRGAFKTTSTPMLEA
jgi:hypothetical protein